MDLSQEAAFREENISVRNWIPNGVISGTIGLWSNTIKEGIHPGKETGAGNGASELFLAMYVAPPGVYLEEVQLPFSPRTKWAEDCVAVCQQEACSLHISSSFFPACLTTSFEASDTDKPGLGIFLEVEFCFCLFCFTYLTQWSALLCVGPACSVAYPSSAVPQV